MYSNRIHFGRFKNGKGSLGLTLNLVLISNLSAIIDFTSEIVVFRYDNRYIYFILK